MDIWGNEAVKQRAKILGEQLGELEGKLGIAQTPEGQIAP